MMTSVDASVRLPDRKLVPPPPTRQVGQRPPFERIAGRRLILVSNLLPYTAHVRDGALRITASTGGVATGLGNLHAGSEGLWIGWPGDRAKLDAEHQAVLGRIMRRERSVPVCLSAAEVHGYYDAFANSVLWPLFHGMLDRLPLRLSGWTEYVRVNERFADTVAEHAQADDLIWVHDYQLLLLPEMLRRRLPNARIGFFLHIPFPPASLFAALPQRSELLRGLLGADLIGFHTANDAEQFGASVSRLLQLPARHGRVQAHGHVTRFAPFPIGIDADQWASIATSRAVEEGAVRLRRTIGESILLGIDRLDYTKGIPRRLLAFETLLQQHPELRGRVRLIQIAVPTRTMIPAYSSYRRRVDAIVDRINETYGTPVWHPVDYVYRGVNRRELVALYRATDVMLVTPLRDGMNLVAKEFVASRVDGDGVLVLSEFTGAADELGEALLVNPFDLDAVARSIYRALRMPETERRSHMRMLRARVWANQAHDWARRFLGVLSEESQPRALELEVPIASAKTQEKAPSVQLPERGATSAISAVQS